jgi:dihydrofolate synthase / folylpolyglutamate synthase
VRVTAIKTARVAAGATSVRALVDRYVDDLPDRSVLAITSKVVSLCENRVGPNDVSKAELIRRESSRYLQHPNPYGFHFTISRDTLIPAAGIDESNVGGGYLLWPADPQRAANDLRHHLTSAFGTREIGVVLTDSTCTPLRRGTSGICPAHSGFRAVRSYVGKRDLFGRTFRVSEANIAGGLAAAAVLVMGEGTERTPICVIEDVPFVEFQRRDPSLEELAELRIPPEDDLFAPFLNAVPWTNGPDRS